MSAALLTVILVLTVTALGYGIALWVGVLEVELLRILLAHIGLIAVVAAVLFAAAWLLLAVLTAAP